jgi:hypothetical protein
VSELRRLLPGGAVRELIALGLKFLEYRSAVLTKNDFSAQSGLCCCGAADPHRCGYCPGCGKSTFVEVNIMTIAILAWGSLIWNPGSLHIEGGWRPGGPALPIEFSRISNNGRLTLVIDERCGVPMPTRFALSKLSDAQAAVRDLQLREGAPTPKGIGIIDSTSAPGSSHALKKHPWAAEQIRQWAQQTNIKTVIWTAIGPRFIERTGTPFSVDAAIHYLASLTDPTKTMALEYIRNAPGDVLTPVRTKVEEVFRR